MGRGSHRSGVFLAAAVLLLVVLIGSPATLGLSCEAPDPDEDPVVGTIRIVELERPEEVIEVPFWTRDGCAQPVNSVSVALHGDWFVFLERERQPEGEGVLKAVNLATDERHQARFGEDFARLALGDPYVYTVSRSNDEPHHLIGSPVLSDEDLPQRMLHVPEDAQTHLGMHTFHRLDTPEGEPPRLTSLELSAWRYIVKDQPLPVSAVDHWRLLGGGAQWSILEQHSEPLDNWETVPDEARVWAFHHGSGKMHEIQIPAETDESDRYGDNDGPKDFAVDGDRLYYTFWEPWSHTHLEGLTLPGGSPRQVHGGEGLSGASVNEGRVLLFVASDEESIPGWDDVEMKRYTSEFDWNELPAITWFPVVTVLALLGVARTSSKSRNL